LNISIVIPIFNAQEYIERAVTSAVNLKEVKEVILVDDGSKDSSLDICKKLLRSYNILKLLWHPNHKNRGVGATRNLGIKNSRSSFISFLDADDYFLENRFYETNKIFKKNKNIDGVYEVVGAHYYSKYSRDMHLERMRETKKYY
jgi:glycosyltransferase involved in cell wall biosynthesis